MQPPPAPPPADGVYPIIPPMPPPLGIPPYDTRPMPPVPLPPAVGMVVPPVPPAPPTTVLPPPPLPPMPVGGVVVSNPSDPAKMSQTLMTNMMSLLLQLTKPEKHIQSADADSTIPPNRTLYVNNLNDKIKPEKIKEELMTLFSPFGEIVQIIAMRSYWRRGQAFVAFRDQAAATKAMTALQGRMLEGKPMRINYAREKSDCFRKEDGTYEPRPKGPKKPRAIREREAQLKEQFEALQNQMSQLQQQPFSLKTEASAVETEASEAGAKRKIFSMSLTGGATETDRKKAKLESGAGATSGVPAPPPTSGGVAAPSNVLFLEELPAECAESDLHKIFKGMEGFEKVRHITSRNLAFVDFKSIPAAAQALDAIGGVEIKGQQIKASFAKR